MPLDTLNDAITVANRLEHRLGQVDVVRLVVAAEALVDDGAGGGLAARTSDDDLAAAQLVDVGAAAVGAHHAAVDGHDHLVAAARLAARAQPRVVPGRVACARLRGGAWPGGEGRACERFDRVDLFVTARGGLVAAHIVIVFSVGSVVAGGGV